MKIVSIDTTNVMAGWNNSTSINNWSSPLKAISMQLLNNANPNYFVSVWGTLLNKSINYYHVH